MYPRLALLQNQHNREVRLQPITVESWSDFHLTLSFAAHTKHVYNLCTMLDQRR